MLFITINQDKIVNLFKNWLFSCQLISCHTISVQLSAFDRQNVPKSSNLLFLALSVPKNISFLKHASVLGVFSVVAVSGAILYETSQSEFTAEQHDVEDGLLFSTSKLSFLQAFPSICFAYQCHISAVPIYRRNEKTGYHMRTVDVNHTKKRVG